MVRCGMMVGGEGSGCEMVAAHGRSSFFNISTSLHPPNYDIYQCWFEYQRTRGSFQTGHGN
jgi:hypothetical protein